MSPSPNTLPSLHAEIAGIARLVPTEHQVMHIHWGGGSPNILSPRRHRLAGRRPAAAFPHARGGRVRRRDRSARPRRGAHRRLRPRRGDARIHRRAGLRSRRCRRRSTAASRSRRRSAPCACVREARHRRASMSISSTGCRTRPAPAWSGRSSKVLELRPEPRCRLRLCASSRAPEAPEADRPQGAAGSRRAVRPGEPLARMLTRPATCASASTTTRCPTIRWPQAPSPAISRAIRPTPPMP